MDKVAKKYGASTREVGNLVGLQRLGLVDLNKELARAREGQSAYSVNAVKAAIEAGEAYEKSSDKSKNALSKLDEAFGRLTGSLKEGEKTGVKGFQNIGSSAEKTTKKISKSYIKLKKEANDFLAGLDDGSEIVEIKEQQKEQLATLDNFRKKGIISEKQAADARVQINENASKKIRDFYIQASADTVNAISSGVIGLLGAIDSFYQASADAASERLEQEREQALEAAGVAEESAVEKAERELQAAKEAGDKELEEEKQIELKRAQINEEFDKKQAELDYNASLRGWELQLAMAKIQLLTAPLNAYVSSLSAPWPLNMILAPINSALALATAGYQYAAVQEARPVKPKYAEGGIVPGSSTGTQIIAGENNRTELISNPDQMANLLNAIGNGVGGGSTIMIHNIIELEGTKLCDFITEASRDGRTKTNSNSIVNY